MANVNITKQALVSALKDLLEDNSFEKISVAAICERCGMNRKSFYYHFKDKYELVTWVYDTEFLSVVVKEGANGWILLKSCVSILMKTDPSTVRCSALKGRTHFRIT